MPGAFAYARASNECPAYSVISRNNSLRSQGLRKASRPA